MSKMIAVCGAPGSGKTTGYIPLARSECTMPRVYIPELQGSRALFGRRGA